MTQKCNLIIDSCCDFPIETVRGEGIYLLKFPFHLSDGGHMDDLYQCMTAHDFFEGMRKGEKPTTAQIPMLDYQAAFEWACKSGVPTVYLSFSGGLTGSFQTAEMIRDRVIEQYPDVELYLVDTKLASTIEGLLVYEAILQRDRGLSAKELAEWAIEAGNYANSIFMVDDLESLKRGGRIPATVAYAGAKLDVKPLLYVDLEGKLSMSGIARGRKKGIKQMIDAFLKDVVKEPGLNYVAIGHADCPKDLKILREHLAKTDPSMIIIETNIGPVIGSHVGPGMLSMAWWGHDRRQAISVADRIARKVKGE